jgi:hypothetical protein
MKHLRKINEEISNEYVLVTWHESGDEIHFTLITSETFLKIKDIYGNSDRDDIENVINTIHSEKVSSFFTQSYALEQWPFGHYNIIKCIYIPDLGC